jgi:lipid A 3-O-deacylase
MLLGLALVPMVAVLPAQAQQIDGRDPSYIALGVGGFDVLHNNTAALFRGEYRFSQQFWIFKPFVGGEATSDGGAYGYGGIGVDVYLGDRFVVTPSFAIGAFEKGNGKNLGSWLEFKSGGEFAYRFDDRSRLGIAFDHISNAGLTKQNPGTESLVLVYAIPFGP